jgi:hypothetical protein
MSIPTLDEEKFNLEIRKFLKKVGINAQREIERAVREGLENGQLKGGESLKAQMTLDIAGLKLRYTIDGEIALN